MQATHSQNSLTMTGQQRVSSSQTHSNKLQIK